MSESDGQRHILIAEDDEAIGAGLRMNLRLEGYRATVATDGEEALAAIASGNLSLVLLDIGLPKMDGLEILASLRSAGDRTPIIIISARQGEYDKVAALRLGADDYVTKPFALAELLARIDAVLRRSAPNRSANTGRADVYRLEGDVTVEATTRSVSRDSLNIRLTHLEFELLTFFLERPSIVFSREHLLREVWGTSGSRRTVDNFVGQLRSKLERDPESPRHFITVRGSGYRFDP